MTVPDLLDRLIAHATLGGAPRAELAWLVAHGSLRRLDEGEVLSAKGTPVAGLFVVLTGHIAIFVDRGAGRHKVMEWRGGRRRGHAALLAPGQPARRLGRPGAVGDSGRSRATDLPAMIRECHEITSMLVHKMLDRSRRLHVERPARREDGLARQTVGRTRARAEQPGRRDRTQRRAARASAWKRPSRPRARWAPRR